MLTNIYPGGGVPSMPESLGHLWEPDQILPSQFFAPPTYLSPEQRLAVALLESALHDLTKLPIVPQRYAEAWTWMMDYERCTAPIPYPLVCETLHLDPDGFAQRIQRELRKHTQPQRYKRRALSAVTASGCKIKA